MNQLNPNTNIVVASPVTPEFANIILYNYGDGNWAGLYADESGVPHIRLGINDNAVTDYGFSSIITRNGIDIFDNILSLKTRTRLTDEGGNFLIDPIDGMCPIAAIPIEAESGAPMYKVDGILYTTQYYAHVCGWNGTPVTSSITISLRVLYVRI